MITSEFISHILPYNELIWVGSCVFIGALVQTALGFGAGLIGMPLLLLIGFNLAEAVFMITVLSATQTALGSWAMRESIPWSSVLFAFWFRIAGLFVGVYALHEVTQLPKDQMKQAMGLAILISLIAKQVFRIQPRDRLPILPSALTFTISGFMASAFGIGGPPLILWTMLKKWSADQVRAFLLTSFTMSLPFSVIWLGYTFPEYIGQTVVNAIVLLPVLLIGTRLGYLMGRLLPVERLRAITTVALTLLSLEFILRPYL